MAGTEAAVVASELERGSVAFLYRPRVEEFSPEELRDVQRVLIRLSPKGSPFERLIAVGRKRPPASATHERFWGYVDLVLAPFDMNAALGSQVYGTRSRGLRHLPAAVPFASGSYEIMLHGPHAHLQWWIERQSGDRIGHEIAIESSADYLITIANPDPAAWGLSEPPDLQSRLFDELEAHVTLPAPFPGRLQRRFAGRRFHQLDTPDWLNHPGAELVFIGAARAQRAQSARWQESA